MLISVEGQNVAADVGDEWLFRVLAWDDDADLPAAPTVAATVTNPAGVATSPAVEDEGGGYFAARVTLNVAGRWLAVVTASGAVVGAEPFTAWASAFTTAGGMPQLAEVKTYLGSLVGDWSDVDIEDAMAAEEAAQRNRCRIPASYPADLRQAFKRRVARNLAARGVPVATFTSFEGGSTVIRVPQLDAEIARFEGPHRRRTVR